MTRTVRDNGSAGAAGVSRVLDRMLMSGTVRDRRAALRSHFDVAKDFAQLEESCIPSYLHPNVLAASVAWARLAEAARMYERWARPGAILDFGSSTGEIAHLITRRGPYCFIEQEDPLARALAHWLPDARRLELGRVAGEKFAAIFALDSLEHNADIAPIVAMLEAGLGEAGVLIVSGPTENLLYRMGRRVAGFTGHYHHQTVWDIEAQMRARMTLLERKLIPLGLPLFSVSVWRERA